jgi:protein-tyrosine phosphatase
MIRELHWVDGPCADKLAIGPRPRGGDWLADEVADWGRVGVGEVVSRLTPDEEESLDLKKEAALVERQGMRFISFPIPDRQVPNSRAALASTLERVNTDLSSGKNVLIHCRQGIGRTGLVAACLLIA